VSFVTVTSGRWQALQSVGLDTEEELRRATIGQQEMCFYNDTSFHESGQAVLPLKCHNDGFFQLAGGKKSKT
jgi:hypothetical protein